MSSITRSLRGQADDTNTRKERWWWISDYNHFGQRYCPWYECLPFGEDQDCNCSLRWKYFTLPAGATVNRATISMTGKEDRDDPGCNVIIYGELAADPAKITSYDDFWARPRTVASVCWTEVPPFKEWASYTSPDISQIIQELVDAFPTGRDYIQLFIQNNLSDRGSRRVFRQGPGYRGNPAQLFIEYNVSPPPVADKWIITAMTEAWSPTGKQICLTTDVPCHLYLRFKDEPPEWHVRVTFRRGEPDTRDPGLAMKEYEQIEQDQAGDTYYHRFDLDPFPNKTRIHYYFIGTIAGGDVKSRSQFFRQDYTPLTYENLYSELWQCIFQDEPAWQSLFSENWTGSPP